MICKSETSVLACYVYSSTVGGWVLENFLLRVSCLLSDRRSEPFTQERSNYANTKIKTKVRTSSVRETLN